MENKKENNIEKEKIRYIIYLIIIGICFFIIIMLLKIGWEIYNKGSLYIKINL